VPLLLDFRAEHTRTENLITNPFSSHCSYSFDTNSDTNAQRPGEPVTFGNIRKYIQSQPKLFEKKPLQVNSA